MSKAEPAVLFAALGDPTRLGLLARLADGGEYSIARLGEGLPVSRQAVAKHLDILQDAGFVRRRKSGREVQITLRREGIETARHWLDQVGAQWDGTLGRLRDLMEGDG
jgi:DNA-binding transcriptional ArsR family regulator